MSDAEKREKVMRGLEAHCETWDEGKLSDCITNPDMCPYRRGDRPGCTAALAADALALLKEQEERIKFLEKWIAYLEGGDPYEGKGVLSHD